MDTARSIAPKLQTLDLETLNLEASKDRGHIEEEVSTTSGIQSPNDEFEIAVCGYMPCRDGKYLVSVWYTIKVQDPDPDPDPDPERPYSSGNVTINKKPLNPFSAVRMMYKTKQHVALGSHLYSLGGLYPVGSDGDGDGDGGVVHPFESKRYRKVWRLDVNRPSAGWIAVPPMTFPNRYDPPSVALQGKLYVLGGFFKSQFPAEAAGKELGWMEAYDPISNTWEPLPNPPSGFFLDADPLIFTALEGKNQILVARCNHDDRICDSATFCIYDVITRSWTKLVPPERKLFARYPDRTERRSIAVDNTLYWGLVEDEDIIVQAYKLDMDIWIHGRINIRRFVAKDEFLADNIFPASPPLLHLNNQRFCLFFLTSCYDRETCQVSNLRLNCLILDISPINDEGKPDEQHDYYDHACYCVIDEKDNEDINYHVHVHDHFWRLNISIVSIEKYPLDNPIQLWDTVLLKQTWSVDTVSCTSEISNTPEAQKKPDQIDVSCPIKNSSTRKAQEKPNRIHGGTMNFGIEGLAHRINPSQANRNSGASLTINNSYKAPVRNPTCDIPIGTGTSEKGKAPGRNRACDIPIDTSRKVSCPGKNSSTRKAQKKPNQIHGGTVNFEIEGSAHQINPSQANRNSGASLTINNSYKAPVRNPTCDIPIGTGTSEKGKAPGGNPTRDIPMMLVEKASEGNQEMSALK